MEGSLIGVGMGVPFSLARAVRRYILTFNGTDIYADFADPTTLTGDFEVYFEFACTDVVDYRTILGTPTADFIDTVFVEKTNGRLNFRFKDSVGGAVVLTLPSTNWADSIIHGGTISRVGDTFKLECDGQTLSTTSVGALDVEFTEIGGHKDHTVSFFLGEILTVKFTDQSGAEDVIINYVIDNGSTIEQYARGYAPPDTEKIVYNNVAASDWELFTLNTQTNCWEAPIHADVCYA